MTDVTTLTADAGDDELDAALLDNPNLHVDLANTAAADFAKAVEIVDACVYPGTQPWAARNLLHYAREPHVSAIRSANQSLQRLAYPGADPAVVASVKRVIIRAALASSAVCAKAIDPETRDAELDRLWCGLNGSWTRPFKKVEPLKDGEIAPVPSYLHPLTLARDVLMRWKHRGIIVEREGDNLKLVGPVHDGDRATARQVKAEILALLPDAILV